MNVELLNKMIQVKKQLEDRDGELRGIFEANKAVLTKDEKEKIKEEVIRVDEAVLKAREEIKAYKAAAKEVEADETKRDEFIALEQSLATKYGVDLYKSDEQEVVKTKKPRKIGTKVMAYILAAAALLTSGILIGRYSKKNENTRTLPEASIEEVMNTPIPSAEIDQIMEYTPAPTEEPVVTPEPTATPVATPEPTPVATPEPTPVATPEPTPVEEAIEEVVAELPFADYGNYTNPQDEAQLEARAHWYFENYCGTQTGANVISEADVINMMRMIGGQFRLDSYGNEGYNAMDLPEVCNDFHTVANYNSFTQMGYNVNYAPIAPYFVDGSLEQKGAIIIDNIMYRVVEAIRNQDDAAFYDAARDYGTAVLNMFVNVDFTGEYPNVHQMSAPAQALFYHAVRSPYASTIFEYQQRRHIDICVPFCFDNTIPEDSPENVEQTKPLSEIMYDLEETPFDAVAYRSGHLEEYQANNYSVLENLFMTSQGYFASKAELELGYAKTLK